MTMQSLRDTAEGIEGGDHELAPMRFHCRHCGHWWEQVLSAGIPVDCPRCEGELPATQFTARRSAQDRSQDGQEA